jgi:hypothetical protein
VSVSVLVAASIATATAMAAAAAAAAAGALAAAVGAMAPAIARVRAMVDSEGSGSCVAAAAKRARLAADDDMSDRIRASHATTLEALARVNARLDGVLLGMHGAPSSTVKASLYGSPAAGHQAALATATAAVGGPSQRMASLGPVDFGPVPVSLPGRPRTWPIACRSALAEPLVPAAVHARWCRAAGYVSSMSPLGHTYHLPALPGTVPQLPMVVAVVAAAVARTGRSRRPLRAQG